MSNNYFFQTFIFCIIIGTIYAQTTAIPDENFEQALIDLNIDSDGIINGSVATADISGVTSLSVNAKNISDLTGIEDFSSLTYLSCFSNSLTTLNVTENVVLSVLICRNNSLSTLDLSQNTNLSVLHCFNNQLTRLNISQNSALGDLKCYNNQLTELDVSQITGMGVLNCSYNQIESLDVSQMPYLANLVCNNNQLTELDISQNSEITNLSCAFNQITSLNVSQQLNLMNLYCNDNSLNSLVMGENSLLSIFYCFNNQISELDVSLNTGLQYFRCYNNDLSVLNVKNGFNSQIAIFDAQNNPSLECIQVDDETAANASQAPYTNWLKDVTATYAEDCGYLGFKDDVLEDTITLYPNPVTNTLTIDSVVELIKVEIYSTLGIKVKEILSGFDALPMNELASGIYIIRIESEMGFIAKQLIKK
ncbi:T9SS type A sorting domain-containing protein [Aestuariivivens sediminis]|uniref:T9SS type A sorting domain-containing protein n=1 Tax=Aestuariivivens sediminis TaxID=2913557 RepID=UPI001F564174|nr:T9SS type A sorting domain-containing protein [Aestuariivivens sediminis]